jgi:hypothetical protein
MKNLVFTGLLIFSGVASANEERRPPKPSAEVMALMKKACEGVTSVGQSCSFSPKENVNVDGTCQKPREGDGPLGCRPNKPPRGEQGAR